MEVSDNRRDAGVNDEKKIASTQNTAAVAETTTRVVPNATPGGQKAPRETQQALRMDSVE